MSVDVLNDAVLMLFRMRAQRYLLSGKQLSAIGAGELL